MELLTSGTRSTSVETLGVTHLIGLHKKSFDTRQKRDPNVSRAFFKHIATWLFRNKSSIENRSDKRFNALEFSWLDCIFIVVIGILCGIIFNFATPTGITLRPEFWSGERVPHVAPQIALEKYREGVLIVDARPNTAYKQGHIKKAINVPLDIFDTIYMMELSGFDKTKTIIVYGRTISRLYDERVSRKLVLRGHNNTMILKGGFSAWRKKGYPFKS
ncbi:MAG: rhodanese-like domain-containing protein [Deltaproteobacteria bacterium]|nr:rhodanese-like domain-containing protein [Deltaproteobacteria bacterium]